MTRTVLILGANGRFGRNACEAFWNAGWQVRRFDRKTDDLNTAACGADVIVNGWNPAYPDWASKVPKLTAQVIEAARKSGATVMLPGNVYVFGKDAPACFSAEAPHAAVNDLGRIRIEMETAYRLSGVRTVILRAGDFIDTQGSGNWFDKVMITSLGKGRLTYPGQTDIPHAWAFLPDMARAMVELAEIGDTLSDFEDIPFPGYTMSAEQMAMHLSDVTGRSITIKPMAWWPIQLLRPFWAMAGKLVEMRYLWDKPHWLDPKRFDQLLPNFGATPPASALALAINLDVDPDKPVAGAVLAAD